MLGLLTRLGNVFGREWEYTLSKKNWDFSFPITWASASRI